jgi:predicted TPR repeat methyltransferase
MSARQPIDLARDEFVSGAYALKGAEDTLAFYRKWADDYEGHMVGELGYVAPRRSAEHLVHHLTHRDAEVLDIDCGTGLTSELLAERGYRRLDGIDLSPAMLAKAAARGIYRRLIRADLTRAIDLPDASYDGMVSSGTFTCGHVGPEPFDELVRLLRPGGLMSICVHVAVWRELGFEARLGALVGAGRLVLVDRSREHIFAPLDPAGLYLVYRRT